MSVVGAVILAVGATTIPAAGCSAGSDGTPDLTGLTIEEAQKKARGAGLEIVETEEIACFLPADTVLGQDPLPGVESTDGAVEVTVSREPVPVQVTEVKTADPQGDGKENNSEIGNLIDGDLSTSWSTEKTYKSPDFQGLGDKKGVGFSFTLAEGATILKISYSQTGWKGEVQKLRANNSQIAIAPLGENQIVTWLEPISSGRVWFYLLAPLPLSPDKIQRYAVTIDEIAFYK